MVTSPPLLYSTARRLSTPWITTSYFASSVSRLVLVVLPCSGLPRTYVAESSAFDTAAVSPNMSWSTMASRRDRFSDLYCSSSTLQISARWSLLISSIRTNMPMMSRYMAGDHQRARVLYVTRMSSCVQNICLWMRSHRLQLNTSKTEFIWCCPSRRRRHIPDGNLLDGVDQVKPVSVARNLGVFVDGELSMRPHISHVAASCFGAMRQIRSIRRSLPPAALEMLVTSLVHSRLDYCNVVFAGLPSCDMRRLQSVLNSSIRLVTGARRYDHVTSLLRERHWLPIVERVEYKLCTLVFRCMQGNAPSYLVDHLQLTSSIGQRTGLRSADTLTLDVPRTRLSFGDRAFIAAGPVSYT